MKQIAFFLVLLSLTTAVFAVEPETTKEDNWLSQNADKISHALAGGCAAGLAYKHDADQGNMVLSAAVVGVLKESWDVCWGGEWDNWDLFATILGGAIFIGL